TRTPAFDGSAAVHVTASVILPFSPRSSSNPSAGSGVPSGRIPDATSGSRSTNTSSVHVPPLDEQLGGACDAVRPRLARQQVDHVVIERHPAGRVVRPRILDDDPQGGARRRRR